jgi:DNA-binding NarL/FixJ family response regulator
MLRGGTGVNAVERIVVQVTSQEKQAIVEKARQLNMTVSELMRSGATEYAPIDADLVELAKAAQASVVRSRVVVDEALVSIEASNARIAAMEAKAKADREELRAEMADGVGDRLSDLLSGRR